MLTNTSPLHYEILNKQQQETWAWLKEFKPEGILGGGTALALQLNHRLSYDFDIFVFKPISKRLLNKLIRIFGKNNISPLIDAPDELTVLYKKKVKITFIYSPFKHTAPVVKTNSLNLFNLKDLAAYKAYAIGRRGTYRDYVDMYFLLQKKFTLKQITIHAKKIFANNFNEKLFFEQLVYFKDLKNFKIEFINPSDKKISPNRVKKFFIKKIERYI